MAAFFSGVLFGALLVAAVFVLVFTRTRATKREPVEWTSEFHEPPPIVTTRVLIRERELKI